MFKRLLIVVLGLMIAFFVQSATAADPKWEEKQTACFEQIGLKPGEVIGQADWKRVEGLIPISIMEWLKKGYLDNLKIAEFKYDASLDDEWVNASRKNAGKYKLDKKKKNLLEAATGKAPLWIHGEPFPYVDVKNDPDGAMKFIFNRDVATRRLETFAQQFLVEWVSPRGLDRELTGVYAYYSYWCKPKGQVRNPRKHQYRDLTAVLSPYDMAGTAQIGLRKLDGSSDDVFVYIPAIRRVKKMSGANRSDPYVGTDFCVDDAYGWVGDTVSMKWRFLEERVGLFSTVEWGADTPSKMKRMPDGSWRSPPDEISMKLGYEVEGWKGAEWAPVNLAWIPRSFYVLEAIALDRFYNYGKIVYWIDRENFAINYKVIYNRAMEYWKTLIVPSTFMEWGGKKGMIGGGFGYLIYDEKSHHASVAFTAGVRRGMNLYQVFDSPKFAAKTFTVEGLRMWSK